FPRATIGTGGHHVCGAGRRRAAVVPLATVGRPLQAEAPRRPLNWFSWYWTDHGRDHPGARCDRPGRPARRGAAAAPGLRRVTPSRRSTHVTGKARADA